MDISRGTVMGFNSRTFMSGIGGFALLIVLGALIGKLTWGLAFWFLAGLTGAAFLLYVAYEMKWLPGWAMRLGDSKTGKEGENSKYKGLTAETVVERLSGRLFGQRHIVEAFAALLRTRLVKTSHEGPLASTLLVGPSGSGKTTCAHAQAEAVYNDPRAVLGFDCARLKHDASVEALRQVGGKLALDKEQVILIEHVEAALTAPDCEFANELLDLVSKGTIGGKPVARRACVVITSDMGGSVHEQVAACRDRKAATKAVSGALARVPFPRGFFDHLDIATSTLPLDEDAIAQVVWGMVRRMAIREFGLQVENAVSGAALEVLVTVWEGGTEDGAAVAERRLREFLEDGFAAAKSAGAKAVSVDVDEDDNLTVTPTAVEEKPAVPVAAVQSPTPAAAPVREAVSAPAPSAPPAEDAPPPTKPTRTRKTLV